LFSKARLLLLFTALVTALAVPSAANAAIVTNGDFETGNLSGWQVDDLPGPSAGDWFTYSSPPTFFPPPQGNFAAATDQESESREILHQDVALPTGLDAIQLSLFAYFQSDAPIFSPDSLDPADPPNEQYRIDVMRPSAPLDSVSPGDILATIFRTATGGPTSLSPTVKTADLSALAGETVRLRFAVTVTEAVLNAAVDAVAVSGLDAGKSKLNKNSGTAKLPVTVTDPGTLSLSGQGVKTSSAAKSVSVGAGSTVKLLVKPKGKTKKKLNNSGKAKVKVSITYTPNGAPPFTDSEKVKLKKN
jgi:hypothetical protein